MFFDDTKQIFEIARRTGFSIFVLPRNLWPNTEKFLTIRPNEKGNIVREQISAVQEFARGKNASAQFIFVAEAEKMVVASENAFLKLLEEPNSNLHIVFLTEKPKLLLPTILSRGELYFLRKVVDFSEKPQANEEVIGLAKEIISANGGKLIEVAEKIAKKGKKSEEVRALAIEVTEVAIEILCKSYFLTKNDGFLKRLDKFLELHKNLLTNGHVKLHLVADLV